MGAVPDTGVLADLPIIDLGSIAALSNIAFARRLQAR